MHSLDVIETLARLMVDQCERTGRLLLLPRLTEADKLGLQASIVYELDSLDLVLRSTERIMLGELDQVAASFSLMQESECELLQVAEQTMSPAQQERPLSRVEPRFVFAAQLSGLEAEVAETRQNVIDKIAELRQLVTHTKKLLP